MEDRVRKFDLSALMFIFNMFRYLICSHDYGVLVLKFIEMWDSVTKYDGNMILEHNCKLNDVICVFCINIIFHSYDIVVRRKNYK